jgi:methylated-DNA-[protein]-cysteine S-methyltransferase
VTQPAFYISLPSHFGPFSIFWRETDSGPRVYRIFLARERASSEELILSAFPGASRLSHPSIAELGQKVQSFLAGEPIRFKLDSIALETCSRFQRRVILAEHRILRGWVSTYGRIAKHLEVSGGARAVGGALARNPFPIVIPCHRTIRSDGRLGGYQGGLDMKRALLKLEGVETSEEGKALTPRMHY